MSNIQLSICIPTYNFGSFIGDTLKSVTDQICDGVEIVIFDGGSTDNTTDVVSKYTERFINIVYHRAGKKGGIDKDLASTIEKARGTYCWLLSSDDALKLGAIQRVLDELKNGHDIYLCNRTECDKDLVPLIFRPWLSDEIGDRLFLLDNKDKLNNYFDKSRSIGALFSYISTIIFRRSRWNEIGYDDRFAGSNYAHVFRLFSIMLKGGTLAYLKDSLILCRGENDSFREQGMFKRMMIDFNGYYLLATQLFTDHDIRHAFLSVMRRNYHWSHFIALKNMAPEGFNWNDFEYKLLDYGYTRTQLRVARIIASQPVFPIARYFWRIISPPKKQ
jgi:abequosyltransferase